MFFEARWFNDIHTSDVIKILKDAGVDRKSPIEDVADLLYKKDEHGIPVYDIYNLRKSNKPLTAKQKVNTIWFFFVFWIFIAPINYVINGRVGISQNSKYANKLVALIGEHYEKCKRYDYKAGWSQMLTREDFLKRMECFKIKTFSDFLFRYANLYEKLDTDGIMIEKRSEINKYNKEQTKLNRFNKLWLTPLMYVIFAFVAPYRWFKYDEFGFDQEGKLIDFYKKMTKER